MDAQTGIDLDKFLTSNKSMIVAPAGHGKTHTIVDCLEQYRSESKKILILTHTHAGIASIREKIAERNIPAKYYEINTICSFSLTLTLSYVPEDQLPDDSDMNDKYRKAQEFAMTLLSSKPIRSVMKAKYDHVIVDEYQDCDFEQHILINKFGELIKVHILGDAMQGIFDFNGSPIDLNGVHLSAYRENCQTLSTPWRWINAGYPELGNEILEIRQLLDDGKVVNLLNHNQIMYIKTNKTDYFWTSKSKAEKPEIIKILHHYLNERYIGDVLILHPDSYRKDARIRLTRRLFNLGMLESIDDRDYYDTLKSFEHSQGDALIASIRNFLKLTCIAGDIDDWIRPDGTFKNKKNGEDIIMSKSLNDIIEPLKNENSPHNILTIIYHIREVLGINRVARKDIFYTIERILKDAQSRNITLLDALKLNRDKVRRIGRSIHGKYIGTTLLTKGLECETVIVLDAHKFPTAEHLYVALSRCSRRLIVASETPILHPPKSRNDMSKNKKTVQLSLFEELP